MLAIFVAGPMTYWALDPRVPIEITEARVMTPAVHPGDFFEIEYRAKRTMVCEGYSLRVILDGKNVPHVIGLYPSIGGQLSDDPVRVRIKVPDEAAPGGARYRATVSYECNPWQRWVMPNRISLPDQAFQILAMQDDFAR